MDKTNYLKEVKKFIKRLEKDFTIAKVIVFGSRARGEARKDSDVDLIIVSEDFEGMGYFKRGALMYNYWKALIAVDFICYTPKEFEKLKNKISIVSLALKEGVIL